MSGKAQLHELAATAQLVCAASDRCSELSGGAAKLVEPDGLPTIGVAADKGQPDTNRPIGAPSFTVDGREIERPRSVQKITRCR